MKKIKSTVNRIGLATLLCPLFIFLTRMVVAQTYSPSDGRQIGGTVTGENNQPLQGVSVLEKGTPNGVSTDEKGSFIIKVRNNNAVLVFSMTGYKAQELTVGNQSGLSVRLIPGHAEYQHG